MEISTLAVVPTVAPAIVRVTGEAELLPRIKLFDRPETTEIALVVVVALIPTPTVAEVGLLENWATVVVGSAEVDQKLVVFQLVPVALLNVACPKQLVEHKKSRNTPNDTLGK